MNSRFAILAILLITVFFKTTAQTVFVTDTTHKPIIAILAPLYLDSLFSNGNYKYGNSMPKFMMPALEFYNGVQLAADSLRQEGIGATIEVIDSRNPAAVKRLFNGSLEPSLIIGMAQNGTELKTMADLTAQHNIPFVSATYPNDAGITARPNLIIVNSTLRTHCYNLYKYLQRNNSIDNLLLITRSGNADDRLKGYLNEADMATAGLKLKWKAVALSDTFNVSELMAYLDSNSTNTAVVASLDDDFGKKVIRTLSATRNSYTNNVFGMPTWDEFPLTKPEYKGVDVYYSTPFVTYSGNARIHNAISNRYKKIANSRPSDMVFRAFELTYRFVKLTATHPGDFLAHINDADVKIFTEFKFEPVAGKKDNTTADYYENKKIYFVKKTDGAIKGVY